MRARDPDQTGVVDRDGVEVYYEVFGEGGPTLMLIPPSPITHSRIWKGLIPHLARHYRVLAIDGRGNGKSGRPVDSAVHSPAENIGNPVSRLYYNASTMICVPTSLAQEVGEALGAQAGEAKLTEVLTGAGFGSVRRATEGPFNIVLEARP